MAIPSGWNTYTVRIWDKNASNFGMVFTNVAGETEIRDLPKGLPGTSGYRDYFGSTSTWDGLSVLGLPVNGSILGESYAGGSHISTGGAQVKNVSISALNPAADHTTF